MRTAITLALAMMAGCTDAPQGCPTISEYTSVTATRRYGCGEPTEAELAAILAPEGCLVMDRDDTMCSTTLETECEPEPGHYVEWVGTLSWDGDGYSGTMARREVDNGGPLCSGDYLLEVRR